MVAQIGGLVWFLPIFSFLLVFVLVYALLKKTGILGGDSEVVPLLVSFILASFFILKSSLVEFVNLSAAWFAVFIVCIFMILALVGFTNDKWFSIAFVKKGFLGWVVIGVIILLFVFSSAQVFNWAINLDVLEEWAASRWFGFVLLVIVAGIVSFVLAKKK